VGGRGAGLLKIYYSALPKAVGKRNEVKRTDGWATESVTINEISHSGSVNLIKNMPFQVTSTQQLEDLIEALMLYRQTTGYDNLTEYQAQLVWSYLREIGNINE
jgi:hypothetical protein